MICNSVSEILPLFGDGRDEDAALALQAGHVPLQAGEPIELDEIALPETFDALVFAPDDRRLLLLGGPLALRAP